jgi:Protein of unknown function (DUF3891)
MVLYPLPSAQRHQRRGASVPAWQAVEKRQRQSADAWWLIAQTDHAVLAGDLAARLEFTSIPALSSDVIRAIALHDAGWAQFDNQINVETSASAAPMLPLSFLEIAPAQFLIAWKDSIDAAATTATVGETIVSEHFCRLARNRLAFRSDFQEDVRMIEGFLSHEARRQAPLRARIHESAHQLETLTDVLQFCDLVSLYLCCGADEPAVFPQKFGESEIRVRCEEDAFLFTPPVFGRGAALGVSARRHPCGRPGTIPFLLG